MAGKKQDPIWVLESNDKGYKVVWCPVGRPQGTEKSGNYFVIADKLTREEAMGLARRLRKS